MRPIEGAVPEIHTGLSQFPWLSAADYGLPPVQGERRIAASSKREWFLRLLEWWADKNGKRVPLAWLSRYVDADWWFRVSLPKSVGEVAQAVFELFDVNLWQFGLGGGLAPAEPLHPALPDTARPRRSTSRYFDQLETTQSTSVRNRQQELRDREEAWRQLDAALPSLARQEREQRIRMRYDAMRCLNPPWCLSAALTRDKTTLRAILGRDQIWLRVPDARAVVFTDQHVAKSYARHITKLYRGHWLRPHITVVRLRDAPPRRELIGNVWNLKA